MNIYKVDHNGSCHSEETGQIHSYKAGVPVELPEDIAGALGTSAQLIEKATPAQEAKKEEEKDEQKEVKAAPKDKMVKGGKTVTK